MDLSLNTICLRTMINFSTRKLLLNRRWMMVVLVSVFVALIMGYVAIQQNTDPLEGGSFLLNTLVLTFLLPIMALIYGASMIRNDIDDRSITSIVTSPMDRRVGYLGYYLALVVVLSLMLLVIGVVGWASFYLIQGVEREAIDLLLAYSLLLVIGGVVYSSLFLVMGVVLRQPIYLGLLYAFVWEALVGSLPGAIGQLTIIHNLKVIGADLIHHGSIAETSGDPVTAALVLAGVTVLLIALGALAFKEKELP
jgi:ABC-2 type transport system permease protein